MAEIARLMQNIPGTLCTMLRQPGELIVVQLGILGEKNVQKPLDLTIVLTQAWDEGTVLSG